MARAMREHDVWVAVDGAAIGWVEVDRDRVAALYVSPSCSRRGVGSALLEIAETSIRNSGYTTARLESSQNALDDHLRRGYLPCGPADSDGAWPLRKDLAAVTPNQGTERCRKVRGSCQASGVKSEGFKGINRVRASHESNLLLTNSIVFDPDFDIESPRRCGGLDLFRAGEVGDGAAGFEDSTVGVGA